MHVPSKQVIDVLSYEGAITSVTFMGVGPFSLVEGVLANLIDNGAAGSLGRLPNGIDTNQMSTDWKLSSVPTPGAANVP